MNTETDTNECSGALHCYRDTCPTCKKAKLDYDRGHGDTRDEPGQPPMCFCPECGETFGVDFERQEKRELAMQMAHDLFTNRSGQVAGRLVMETGKKLDGCGWCESAVEELLFAALCR